MFKSSVVFLFAASLLCTAQNSQPTQQTQPQSPSSQPAAQAPGQSQSPQTVPAATTPDQPKAVPEQGPRIKIKIVPSRKPENRVPTGTLDQATPV